MPKTQEENRAYWRGQARLYRILNGDKIRALRRADYWRNRDTLLARGKVWRQENPDTHKNAKLVRAYGITVEQYWQIFKLQNGVCAICKYPETKTWKKTVRRLAVDHDHSTNKVRGLLCSDCNVSLGKMRESPQILRAAAIYLENPLVFHTKEPLLTTRKLQAAV